jgi:hypothetical protein
MRSLQTRETKCRNDGNLLPKDEPVRRRSETRRAVLTFKLGSSLSTSALQVHFPECFAAKAYPCGHYSIAIIRYLQHSKARDLGSWHR